MSPRQRPAPDPRHGLFRLSLEAYWRSEDNATVPELPWGAGEAGALAAFLRANPTLTITSFRRLLEYRLASDDHARGESPRVWLSALTRYANGPLDRYKLPKSASPLAREATVGTYRPDGEPSAPVSEEEAQAEALAFWRHVQTSNPKHFERAAPRWARQQLGATVTPAAPDTTKL